MKYIMCNKNIVNFYNFILKCKDDRAFVYKKFFNCNCNTVLFIDMFFEQIEKKNIVLLYKFFNNTVSKKLAILHLVDHLIECIINFHKNDIEVYNEIQIKKIISLYHIKNHYLKYQYSFNTQFYPLLISNNRKRFESISDYEISANDEILKICFDIYLKKNQKCNLYNWIFNQMDPIKYLLFEKIYKIILDKKDQKKFILDYFV